MPNFTTEDLLMYLYNELPGKERQEMEDALRQNWALREKLQVLREATQRMDRCKLKNPRRQAVDSVIHYAADKVKVSS